MGTRILYFCPFMQHGGTERHLYNLLSKLPREFESIVCAPTGPMTPLFEKVAGRLEPGPKPFRVTNLNIAQAVRDALADVRGRIESIRPDIIHVHASRDTAFAVCKALEAMGTRCPIVLTPHVYPGIGDYLWTSFFARAVDRVIAVSNSERVRLARFLPRSIRSERVVSIYNGTPLADTCDDGALSAKESARAHTSSEVAEQGQSPDSEFVIGTVGRLSKEKGTVYLLRAFRILATEFPNARLVIIGGGDLKESLQREAQSLGIADRVTFAGVMDNPATEMSRFDVFVSPSLNESLSMVIIEAMALGRPVVATRVGATHEAVIHGETGLICRPGRPDELASNIRTLLLSPGMRRRMGEAGRQRAANLFSAQRMVDKTVGVYRGLLLERR